MSSNCSRYGLFVSALGATLLVVAVFLPWYGVSLTSSGIALAQQFGTHFAAQVGSVSLQDYVNGMHVNLGVLSDQQLTAVSAHQVITGVSILLLVLAGLAMLDAIFPLARTRASVPGGAGGSVVLLGSVAMAFVLYRMIFPPTPGGDLVALSLREGAWLALLGSMMMVLGGLWPRTVIYPMFSSETRVSNGVWPGLPAGG